MTTKISGANISSIGNTGLNWQAVTVADGSTQVNATSGNGYLLDTNAGVIEVFLPTSPTRGDTVVLADYSGTFATNKVIVNTGGALIDSTVGSEVQITTNNTIAEFVYTDSAKGWLVKLNQAAGTTPSSALTDGNVYDTDAEYISATGGTITTSGDFKIHTFTADGCFVVSGLGNPTGGPDNVDYLVVAGGGGSGPGFGGAGGAGGFRESHSTPVSGCYTASPLATPTGLTMTTATYPITVGGGGAVQSNGSNSVFSTITSTGGGKGADQGGNPTGSPGGSGGGGAGNCGTTTAGNGNTPPVNPPQGNPGGAGSFEGGHGEHDGGGGGALSAGGAGPAPRNGGDGAGTEINPSPCVGTPGPSGPLRYFAGGGGGGDQSSSPPAQGVGGVGGGGRGGITNYPGGPGEPNTNGTANTGGGGGSQFAGTGGSGIVIIRYKFQN